MGENTLYSSFMMLTEHLYSVFAQYIISGRTRAPPESELIEMLPTFQFGAKTDRRALQSKFKSWAKRMNFENGHLTLISSGKVIIPKEKCDALIMHLHSEEHRHIEIIISQIRMTYSWTKKNFGMDRDVVVESIFRNCTKDECHKNMSLEVARFSGAVSSGQLDTDIRGPTFKMPSPIQCIPPYHYRWPFHVPVEHMFPGNTFPIQIPYINGMYNLEYARNAIADSSQAMNISLPISKYELSSRNEEGNRVGVNKEAEFPSVSVQSFDARPEKTLPVRFKKPKNVCEYNSLMEAARLRPKEYPNILKSEKIKFLSKLGIAPKSICSSRTMKRFRQELRKKKLMTRNCIIYRERKVLRDRNKLKKRSQDKRKHFYLGLPTRKDQTSKRIGKFSLERRKKNSFLLKFSRKLIRLTKEKSRAQNKRASQRSNPKPIEIIDIVTSEDETQETTTSSNIAKGKKNAEIEAAPTENGGHKSLAPMPNTLQEADFMKNKNILNDGGYKLPFAETSYMQPHSDAKESLYLNKEFNAQRILLPKMVNHGNPQVNTIFTSSIPFPIKRLPAPRIVGSYTVPRNSPRIPAGNFLLPQTNPAPVPIRPKTPVFTPPQGNFTGMNQNISPRIVYPIHVPKSAQAKVFFIDKEQKGAYIVIPQYHRPILPRNSPGTETKETSSAKEPVKTNPLLKTSHILPQKPGNIERKTYESKKTSAVNELGNSEKEKNDMQDEMMRILKWIYRMKSNLNPCMFKHGIEKSVQNLISQLNVGIYLVREAKKSLEEIESCVENRRLPSIKIK